MTYESPRIFVAGPSNSLIQIFRKIDQCKEIHTHIHLSAPAYEVDE